MITFSNLGKPEWGRLGNQLFQIASTLGIAYQSGQEAVFPRWSYSNYFANPLPEGYLSDCKKYVQKGYSYRLVNLTDGNWDLLGFFQSEKYFFSIESKIREQFSPSFEVISYINDKYGLLLSQNTCSLHIRRGDYLKLSLAFPPQSLEYYYHAISQFSADTQFLVFSDDINWCREKLQGPRFNFIEDEKDIIDLMIMSRCKHHIISNSSFSWWGAWLNPNSEKRVLCPAWWFGPAVSVRPKYYARDLYAQKFLPLTLPNEHTWLKHMYYAICGPFFQAYFKFFEMKYKISKSLLVKKILYKFKFTKA